MGMLGIHDGVDTGPGLTKQSMRDEVNINKIVARFDKTGMVDHLNDKAPFYGDVSELMGYQDALNVVNEANLLFSGMSADIRERFGNDPARMLNFLDDPSNLDEAVKLGMVVKRPVVDEADVTPPVGPVVPSV